jgi:hypothetical protein
MAEDAPLLTATLAAIRRRPLTLAYAGLLVEHLAFAISREADYPSSPKLHERLETIEALSRRGRAPAARERVLRELADPRIFALLSNGDARIERALTPLLHPLNLPYVGRLAAKARERVPRERGRRKFYPDHAAGPDAPEYCALIVSVAWQKDASKWPGMGKPMAQFICELLWRKAGGVPHARHGGFDAPDTFATWRKHLVAARRYRPPHPAGELVARILAGDPPKRRLQLKEEQSRRWGRFYDHPRERAGGRSKPP